MLTERRDYLLRLIQQAGAAARRLRELLTGEADASDIAKEAEGASATLLGGGGQAQLLERLDAQTAVQLLGDVERVRAWVALLRVQSDALRQSGKEADAARIAERATALEQAAANVSSSLGA